MIGFHMQSPVPDWPQAAALLPAGTWVKAVSDQGICREYKRYNPGLKVVFRYEYNDRQHLTGDYHELARKYFRAFIDGTFWANRHYLYIDAIEEWNEYLANSQSAAERAEWVKWCRAVNEVWTAEYRIQPELAHIRLVSCNTAIGNDIHPDFARIVQQHDGILAYHNYTVVRKGIIPEAEDWQYYSGRWTAMDAAYRAQGITVDWLFTEGGACTIGEVDGVLYSPHVAANALGVEVNALFGKATKGVNPNTWYSGVTEGWKHKANYNGNLTAYIQGAIKYQIDRTAAWNKVNGGRALGHTLFTTANSPGVWDKFQLGTAEWRQIAQFVRDYAPAPEPPPIDPPPPPSGDPVAEILTFARSITDANNDSALQLAMWRDGWDIGGPERWTTIDGVQYAVKPAVKQGVNKVRAYYCRVPNWSDIRWVEG